MKLSKNTKNDLCAGLLGLIIAFAVIALLFSNCAQHTIEFLSPAVSVRSANKEDVPFDYQIASTVINYDNKIVWYEEFEREIGDYYRERQLRFEAGIGRHKVFGNDYLKTARYIWNSEFGYLYVRKLPKIFGWNPVMKTGSSVIFEHAEPYLAGNTELVWHDLVMKYARGKNQQIMMLKFEKTKSLTSNIYWNTLIKYYESNSRFWQVKTGLRFKFDWRW